MASAAPVSSDVLHLSTQFDDSVHEYQFARSHPQLFAQLQQLIVAKYPLSPLYIHYLDEDGDMVRVTNEAELREAVQVCGSRLNLVLSSGLPSSSASSPAPHQQSIASPTLISYTPSPTPSLTSVSPLRTSSFTAAAVSEHSIDDIDDYLSSDEEELFEQARSQVRSRQQQQPTVSDVDTEVESEAEVKSPRYGVVALDSEEEEEEEEEANIESSASSLEVVAPVSTQSDAEEQAPVPAAHPATEPIAAPVAVVSDISVDFNHQRPVAEPQEELATEVQPSQSASPLLKPPQAESVPQLAATSDITAEEKSEFEDGVEAISARLRSFYQLDQQRHAVISSATTDTIPNPPVRSTSPVPVASLFTSFFAEPEVIATIRDNAALLTPLMTSLSFPVFLHRLCLLNPALSSHSLARYSFSVSSLHPFTVCAHCSASPVVGRLMYCRDCDFTLCGTCQQQGQHPTDHQLAELPLPEYRRESGSAVSPSASTNANAASNFNVPRLDDGGRVLEERKASDFAELSDRMRASGQRVWKQGAVSLRKVDEMLTQFAADIKRMIESMLDGVFDAPKPSQQSAQQSVVDEQKQPVASPRSRQQQANGCNVRRPQCLVANRPNMAAPVDVREAGVALAQPMRQNMSVAEPRVDEGPRPQSQQQQQASSSFAYRAQLDVMGDMGLIRSTAEEETCKELLTASKGDIAQSVQWLMDRINV